MTRVRPIATLKLEQAEMLEALTTPPAEVVTAAPSTFERPAGMVGRVAQVVTEDESLGPHLAVVLQRFTGTPPAPEDATAELQVYYPWPGRSVGDYSENELVVLIQPAGARLACKG